MPPPAPESASRLSPWAAVLLLAGVAAGYFLCLTRLPLIRAEAHYALIPLEMLRSGDWLTPTLNGVPYLDKPPLLFWLNGLIFLAWGASEAGARLVNLFLALGEVWLTYRLGCLLFSPRIALFGAFALAASLGFFVLHLELLADHLITFWLLAGVCLWLKWLHRPRRFWELGFYACLAGGFLSKGLIGLAFPLGVTGLTALAAGRREGLALLVSPRGWLLVAALLLPWLAALELQHPGFLRHHLLNEQVLRFLGQRQPPDITPFSAGAFWLLLALWLLPWTPLLPEAWARFWSEEAGPTARQPLRRLVLVWPAVILGFFTLSGSRVEYYSLPALPPLALLVGWRLHRYLRTPADRALPLALFFLAAVAVLPLLFLPRLEGLLAANRREFLGLAASLGPLLPTGLLTLAAWGLAGGLLGWRRPRLAAACLAGLAVSLLAVSFRAGLALSPALSDKLPGEWLKQHLQPGDLVIMENVEEYEYAASLAFYAGRPVEIVVRQGLPRFPLPVSPEKNYLISPARLEELWRGAARVYVLADASAKPAAPWQEATPVLATATRRLFANRPPANGPHSLRTPAIFPPVACHAAGKKLSLTQLAGSAAMAGIPRNTPSGAPPGRGFRPFPEPVARAQP